MKLQKIVLLHLYGIKCKRGGELYTKEILEFAAVGVRYAALLEQASERDALVEQLVALLPQLYSVTLPPSLLFLQSRSRLYRRIYHRRCL